MATRRDARSSTLSLRDVPSCSSRRETGANPPTTKIAPRLIHRRQEVKTWQKIQTRQKMKTWKKLYNASVRGRADVPRPEAVASIEDEMEAEDDRSTAYRSCRFYTIVHRASLRNKKTRRTYRWSQYVQRTRVAIGHHGSGIWPALKLDVSMSPVFESSEHWSLGVGIALWSQVFFLGCPGLFFCVRRIIRYHQSHKVVRLARTYIPHELGRRCFCFCVPPQRITIAAGVCSYHICRRCFCFFFRALANHNGRRSWLLSLAGLVTPKVYGIPS
jgi:hypothetical protein